MYDVGVGLLSIAFKIIIISFMVCGIILVLQGVVIGSCWVLDKTILRERDVVKGKRVRKPLLGLKISHEEKGHIVKTRTL